MPIPLFKLPLLILGIMLTSFPSVTARADDSQAAADHAVVEALMRLPERELRPESSQSQAVARHLARIAGTQRYFQVARELGIPGQQDRLLQMLTAVPFDPQAVEAARLLARERRWEALERALQLEDVSQSAAAARAIGFLRNAATQKMLRAIVENERASLQLRIAATEGLGKTEEGQGYLLELARTGELAADISFAATDSLLGSDSEKIRTEARKVVEVTSSASSEPIPPVRELVRQRGDASRGAQVFAGVGTCNKCHRVHGQGKEVGPDLSEIGSKLSREDMFVAILNPNAAISHNYESYVLLDVDGHVHTGLLINQTDEEIVIRDKDGIDHQVAAEDVESLKKQAVSLMPADLQKAMTLQQLVDLVDYLGTLRRQELQPSEVAGEAIEIDNSHDPSNAIAGFEIDDRLEVQLFANEPQIYSPTSIDVDAQGRIWVCEAVNYRHFRNPQNQERSQGDRILVLEDEDGDGQADKKTVFYQDREIDSPHGVCVLGNEVIVSAGENVIVFTDKDGDLKPDSKRYLFTGISGVQHDHGIHAFAFGPDGKLYFNFGNEGKQLKGPNGETVVDMAGNRVDVSRQPYQEGMVFRCNLDGSQLETLGWNFRNNWEVCVDSFGNLWQSDNDDDGNRGTRINFVMEFGNYGYKDEKTGASWRADRIGLEDSVPQQHWHLNDPGVVPNILQTGAGSPTGIFFYEGTLLPAAFQNQLLHTDPGPNVVRAYPVELDGAGYQASILNMVKGVRDPWFRPVDICAAPDGSLFVADWYDPGVGGHRMGDIEHGRIFRIVPKGHPKYDLPELDLDSSSGILTALQSPNLATRYLASEKIQQLGTEVVPALESFVEETDSDRLRARALWQLGLVGGDAERYVGLALASPNPQLRVMGIRMARQHKLDMLDIVERFKGDPSMHVLRELAISLRHKTQPHAAELWADLALRHDGQDRWYLEALGIGADQQWDRFFTTWLEQVGEAWDSPAGKDIVWRCRSPKACRYLAELIRQAKTPEEQYRYFRAFDFHEGEAKATALSDLVTQN